MMRPLTNDLGGCGAYWFITAGPAGINRSPWLISCVELTMRIVAGSPTLKTRAVPRNIASNPSVLFGVRIHQWATLPEYLPDCLFAFADSAYVCHVSGAQIDGALLGTDDARRLLQTSFLNHQGLRQERLDELGRNRWNRLLRKRFDANLRRKLDGLATNCELRWALGAV